jgi:hypothetical protein
VFPVPVPQYFSKLNPYLVRISLRDLEKDLVPVQVVPAPLTAVLSELPVVPLEPLLVQVPVEQSELPVVQERFAQVELDCEKHVPFAQRLRFKMPSLLASSSP